jgi:hypothetical protein
MPFVGDIGIRFIHMFVDKAAVIMKRKTARRLSCASSLNQAVSLAPARNEVGFARIC